MYNKLKANEAKPQGFLIACQHGRLAYGGQARCFFSIVRKVE